MLPFSKKTFIARIIFFVILTYGVFLAPFWFFMAIGVIGAFIFPLYIELTFFIYVRESLFVFDTTSLMYAGATLVFLSFVYWLRTQIRL